MKKYFLIPLALVVILSGLIPVAHAQQSPNERVSQAFGAVNGCSGSQNPNGTCNLGYTPLEPIPGVNTASNLTTAGGFANLINALFKILISAGALLAVLSLTVGGVQYMVTGSAALKGKAIERVKASLWGILLIAAIWLILNTINPHLLDFNFNPCPPGSKSSVCTSIAKNNSPVSMSGNNNDSSASSLDAAVKQLNNDTPNPGQCEEAGLATGLLSPTSASSFTALGNAELRGASQLYYAARAAFWDTDVRNTNTPITDMYRAGATAYNSLNTANANFVAKCQGAGMLPQS